MPAMSCWLMYAFALGSTFSNTLRNNETSDLCPSNFAAPETVFWGINALKAALFLTA